MARGATMRLFVAIDPPRGVCEQLAAWTRQAAVASGLRTAARGAPLRLLDARSLHLTLCFLGERPAQEVDAIDAALDACATDVGELSVGAPLWLPARRARALAVEVHDRAGELGGLHDALVRAIAEATTWEPERRRFRAHLTVARVRGRGRSAHASSAGTRLPATPRVAFSPEAVTLYRSSLAPEGAAYEALASSRLLPREL
jgi:RNA 2',3'-cyclic 3'-phosphodiesterase